MKQIAKSQIVRKLGLFLLTSMVVASITACGNTPTPSTTEPSEAQIQEWDANDAKAKQQMEYIKEIEGHLALSSDGLLELAITADGLTPELSEGAQAFFEDAQEGLNEKILSGEVTINDNFEVEGTEELAEISADWASWYYYWWGVVLYMSNDTTEEVSYLAGHIGTAAGMAAASGVGVLAGAAGYFILNTGSWYISHRNHGNGVRCQVSWRYWSYCSPR